MIKLQKLPKFTLSCYFVALFLIGLIFADQYLALDWFNPQVRVGTLVSAAIIGVLGSLVSLTKQLKGFLKK